MKLTALEIKQQSFDRTIRGYDVAEVQAFLNMAATEWEAMMSKMRELERRIEELNSKIEHYEKVEMALHETLLSARESAESRMEEARKDARNLMDKAQHEAESIVREATVRKQTIRQSANQLLDRRGEMVLGMRAFLERTLSSLEQFDRDEEGLFRLPSEHEPRPDAPAPPQASRPLDGAQTRETPESFEAPDVTQAAEAPDATLIPDASDHESDESHPDASTSARVDSRSSHSSSRTGDSSRNALDDILDELD